MKKTFLIIIILSKSVLIAQSTDDYHSRIENICINSLCNGMWVKSENEKTDVKGSPYLYDSWFNNGKIFLNNMKISLKSFNYNMKYERFEAKISKDSVFAINPQGIKKVQIRGDEFIRILDPEFQRNSYFQKIFAVNGKLLLEKHTVELKEAKINPMTMQKTQKDALIKKEEFYIANDKGEQLKKVKVKKSLILSLIDKDKVNTVKEFAKKYKLRYNNSKDLIKLFKYVKTI